MAEQPSLISILALVLVIVVIFAVLILYIIYFLNRDISIEFGQQWEFVNVSDTIAEIFPRGNQILTINGGSASRGTNPDFLYIGQPTNVPYVGRIFIIFNRSNSAQLELRGDNINFDGDVPGQFTIATLSGTIFFWKNKDTIIPIITGTNMING